MHGKPCLIPIFIFNHFDLNYYDINSVFLLWTPPCLLGHVRNFLEKHRNVRTVIVCTVTFYVHVVTLVCNGADIFKFICLNMHFLVNLCCSFYFQLIAYKLFDIKRQSFDIICILSVFSH